MWLGVVLNEHLDHTLRTGIEKQFEAFKSIRDIITLSDEWLDVNLASGNQLDGQGVAVGV